MSLVFQNIDPPSPSPPGECVPVPPLLGGGEGEDTLAGRREGWGSIFWKTRGKGLPSYSINLSTVLAFKGETLKRLPRLAIMVSSNQGLKIAKNLSFRLSFSFLFHLIKKIFSVCFGVLRASSLNRNNRNKYACFETNRNKPFYLTTPGAAKAHEDRQVQE
jgi:hypothetical protein